MRRDAKWRAQLTAKAAWLPEPHNMTTCGHWCIFFGSNLQPATKLFLTGTDTRWAMKNGLFLRADNF